MLDRRPGYAPASKLDIELAVTTREKSGPGQLASESWSLAGFSRPCPSNSSCLPRGLDVTVVDQGEAFRDIPRLPRQMQRFLIVTGLRNLRTGQDIFETCAKPESGSHDAQPYETWTFN